MKSRITITQILYIFWQWTWGFVQSLVGVCCLLKYKDCRHYLYRGCVVTEWERRDGVSMGMFIFVPSVLSRMVGQEKEYERFRRHEYGHTIQSLLLGPLYLLVIGLPSFTWCRLPALQKLRKEKQISYYSFYTEKWADYCGEKV